MSLEEGDKLCEDAKTLVDNVFNPPLFDQTRIRKPEYWQCIKLIAPTREKKSWKASDASGAWCTKCNSRVYWKLGNPHGIQRHMNSFHRDLIKEEKNNTTKKRRLASNIEQHTAVEETPDCTTKSHDYTLTERVTGMDKITNAPVDEQNYMHCVNPLSIPLHTDMYQITMAYAYWKAGRSEENAVFDLFFRKNPFKGEYTIFAGLSEAIALISSFKFSAEDIEYVANIIPQCDPMFIDWLALADCSNVKVYAISEGSVVFPRIPLLRVEGPLPIVQLLETPLLNLINYPSLICTNAARFRNAAGNSKTLIEFGLRRAQGPDGGLSASRYSYMGGFDATSNILAGKIFGLPVKGTHAHSFVQSYLNCDQIKHRTVDEVDLVKLALEHRERLRYTNSNEGELAAFCAYSIAFPNDFLALVDTYDTLQSGVPNFIAVALALDDLNHAAKGIRLDSGDLAYLSKEIRSVLKSVALAENRRWLGNITIVASNDINENVLRSLDEQGHSIDAFGIGTNLVTCQAQPALGGVYKLVEIEGVPRIKISENIEKVTVPGRKSCYRLYGMDGFPILDLMQNADDSPPEVGVPVLCKHPFDSAKRLMVTATRVKSLHKLVWDGKVTEPLPSIIQVRSHVLQELSVLREDIKRDMNPTPYKVSLNNTLFSFMHELWEKEAPIKAIS